MIRCKTEMSKRRRPVKCIYSLYYTQERQNEESESYKSFYVGIISYLVMTLVEITISYQPTWCTPIWCKMNREVVNYL